MWPFGPSLARRATRSELLPSVPSSRLEKTLGQAGEIEPETEGILLEYEVDFSEFSDEVLDCLPKNLPWAIPPEEIGRRRDLRWASPLPPRVGATCIPALSSLHALVFPFYVGKSASSPSTPLQPEIWTTLCPANRSLTVPGRNRPFCDGRSVKNRVCFHHR